MAIRQFDARHLSSNRAYQVQMVNWYEVVVPGLSDDFRLLTQSVTLPEIGTDVVEVGFGNSKAKYAGQATFSDSTCVITDAISKDVEAQILEWQGKVYDTNTGKAGWVDEYKKDVAITQYGPDGTYERSWVLHGAFPSSVAYGEMSSDSADKKTISITLSYDYATRDAMRKG